MKLISVSRPLQSICYCGENEVGMACGYSQGFSVCDGETRENDDDTSLQQQLILNKHKSF